VEGDTYSQGWLRGMPLWLPRLMLLIVVTVAAMFFGLAVLRQLRSFLVLLLISVFLSVALEPGVAYLQTRGWRRGLGTAAMFGLVVVGVGPSSA